MSVSSAPGTGAVTLGAALAGYQSFSAAGIKDGDTFPYVIEDANGAWETGIGTYSASDGTVARTLRASSTGSLLDATAAATIYISPGGSDLFFTGNFNPNAYLPLAGGEISGGLTVDQEIFGKSNISVATPTSNGTTGGVQLRGNTASTPQAFFQITDNPAQNQWGVWIFDGTGLANWSGALASASLKTTGVITAGGGVNFGDAQFYTILQASNPIFNFNPNAFIEFNRSTGTMILNTASGEYLSVDGNGNTVATGKVQSLGMGNIGQFEMPNGTGSTWYNAGWRNDGTTVYLLSSAAQSNLGAAQTATWNSNRPFTYNLATGAVTLDGGSGNISLNSSGNNQASVKSDGLHLNNWIRVDTTNTGIYWTQYGGGWYMQDSTWLRTYGNKGISTGGGGLDLGGGTITSANHSGGTISGVTINNGSWIGGCTFDSGTVSNSSLNNCTTSGINFPNGVYIYEDNNGSWVGDFSVRVYNGNYSYFTIQNNGNVSMASFTVNSDRRIKTDIEPLNGTGELIDCLNAYSYRKSGRREWGVIAQELQEIAPDLVHEGREGMLSVDYNSLFAAVLAEVKALRQRVAFLEAERR